MKVLICNFESLHTPSGVASYAIKLLRHLPCMEALTTRNTFQTPLEERESNLEAKTRYNEIFWMKPARITLMNRKIRESDLIHHGVRYPGYAGNNRSESQWVPFPIW